MPRSLAKTIESDESNTVFRKLTPEEFSERLRELETREIDAAADALWPALSRRPAVLRSVLGDESPYRPIVLHEDWDDWDAPDEMIVLAAKMPSGAVAALVTDALPGVRTMDPPDTTQRLPKTDAVLINAKEAAQLLGISEVALRGRVADHKVPGVVRTGRRVQFHRATLLASIERKAARR